MISPSLHAQTVPSEADMKAKGASKPFPLHSRPSGRLSSVRTG